MNLLVVCLFTLFVFSGSAFAQAGENSARDLQLKAARAAELGNYDDARKLYLQAVDKLLSNDRQAEAGTIYTQLGEVAQIHGSFPTAEATFKKSIDLLTRYAQPNDLRLGGALDDLGWLYVTWGRLADGSRFLDQARTLADRAQPNDPSLIRHFDTQAAYLTVIGKYSEAQRDWNRALEIGEANYGPDGPEYDSILVHSGQASALRGNYEAAAGMFRRYLDIDERISKIPTPSRAVAAAELAHAYAQLHKFSEARTWFDEAAGIFNSNPDGAPLIQSMLFSYLGDFYMARADWSNAQLQYRKALSIQQRVLGENRAVAACMISLSNALKKLRLKDEAKDLVARAKAIVSAQQNNALRAGTVDVMALRRQ
jgi:tetratricopeptide (TPR) repeat protein